MRTGHCLPQPESSFRYGEVNGTATDFLPRGTGPRRRQPPAVTVDRPRRVSPPRAPLRVVPVPDDPIVSADRTVPRNLVLVRRQARPDSASASFGPAANPRVVFTCGGSTGG